MTVRDTEGDRRADEAGETTEGPARTEPSAGRRAVVFCLVVFLASRALLSVLALAAVAVLPAVPLEEGASGDRPAPVGVPGWPASPITPGWHNLVTAWERFDALWYLRIAEGGYEEGDGSAAFFPLFPLAVRAVSFLLGGHPLAAGLLVSNAAALGALLALYALTRRELSEDAARAAVVFAAFFPTAFFFVAPYTESLFLLLALVSFWAARSGRWALAGTAGALAALTRNVGVLLVLPLALEAVQQARETRRWRPASLFALAPAVGTLAYLWFWQLTSGNWLAPLRVQSGWERSWGNPLVMVVEATRTAFRYAGQYPGGYHLLDWLVAVPVLAAGVYALLRLRPSYAVYVWAGILSPLVFAFEPRPLMSFPRFALVLFPVFWAFARWTQRSDLARHLALAASAALLGVHLLLFVSWLYVF